MKSTVVGLRSKGVNVRVLDASSHMDKVAAYSIRAVPSFVYVRDGQVIRKKAGRLSEAQMLKLCRDTW